VHRPVELLLVIATVTDVAVVKFAFVVVTVFWWVLLPVV